MNRKKIGYTILVCFLISWIVFYAVAYSEPLKNLFGIESGLDIYGTVQSEAEAGNADRKLEVSEHADSGEDKKNTYEQENKLLIAEQTNEDQYMTSRGEANRASNEKPKAVSEHPKTAVIKDEPDNSESMNINTDTTQEASLAVGSRSTVPAEEEQETTDVAGDLDLLARLITAEAQGEPYEAQVAVGAVVMNRVESSSWPDSIEGVIYQVIDGYYQFTPVDNGWIDKPAQEQSIKAVREVLGGADPTKGAQFYYDDTTTNPWILEKTVSVQIGHMIFAY